MTRKKRRKIRRRMTKNPRSLLPPRSRLPRLRERGPSLLLRQLQSSRRKLMSLGNPTMKNPKPKPMPAMMLSARPRERQASYLRRRQIVPKTPRKRGRAMIVRRMIAMRIARAKTATKTGSNSAPRLLHICVHNLFPSTWAIWRLALLSHIRYVESAQRCVVYLLFLDHVEWDVLPRR